MKSCKLQIFRCRLSLLVSSNQTQFWVALNGPNRPRELFRILSTYLSFQILGVGNADFDAMDDLDGDGKLLKSPINGQRAKTGRSKRLKMDGLKE